jgi:hypothetical protein
MAITSVKTGSSFTNLQKYDTAVASNPPLMAAPTATDGGTGSTASVAFTTVTGATSYGVLSSPGSFTATGTSSPLTVSGLTSGTAYTFQVRGINSTSTGPYSAASNSVTPVTPSSYESIATFTATGSETLFSFTSIPSTYKSLQIRTTARQSSGTLTTSAWFKMQFNSDTTAANYTMHGIQGTGAAAQGNWGFTSNGEITAYYVAGNSAASNIFGVGITDIIDYASTTKNKTVRSIGGNDQNGSGSIFLSSGLWVNTAAINRIDVYGSQTNSFAAGTTIALYGVK